MINDWQAHKVACTYKVDTFRFGKEQFTLAF